MEKQEALIDDLNLVWRSLSRDIENLSLPGLYSKKFFKRNMLIYPIKKIVEANKDNLSIQKFKISIKQKPEKCDGRPIWKTLFDKIKYFEHVQLVVVKGVLSDKFIVDLKFDALARSRKNKFLSLQVKFSITLENFLDVSKVKISEWKNKKITMQHRDHLLFEDVTEQILTTPDLVDLANGSKRESLFALYLKKYRNPKM
ncbi:hypothetical protein [Candidatus Uabimicrobium amorphum]|uniref:hypothetical protein n=1 Tax=Uabimicrobium amorphum TaxID=2596890 RepID=UPI00125F3B65|nr:hypothetical protein [Candidatus Uabimicrobium amorphum]